MPPLYRDSTSCNLLTDREKSSECANNPNTVTRVKCVLVGDGAIGKTSLIVSYTTNGYPTEYVPTAFDNYSVVVTIDNNPCQLQLCDTAGQDDFDTLRPLCYPQTNVFLLCFSVVCPTSFHNIQEKWLPEIRRNGNKAPVILVGTQCDLRHDVKVLIELAQSHEQPVNNEVAKRVANKIGAIKYIECSALTQKNLKEVFDTAILTGIEYEQQLIQKSSMKSSSNLVSWGKAQGKKLLRTRCRDQNNTSTCSSSSSTSTSCSSGSNFCCNETSLPPIPYPRKESTTVNSAFSDAGAQKQHHFCQHSNENKDKNSNSNTLRKGWRRFCCGL